MVNVLTIKAFNDNYIWLIKDSQSQHCIIVDPGDASPVLEIIESQQLILDAILLTHHHYDHVDGVAGLLKATDKDVVIYSKNKIFLDCELVKEGDILSFFNDTFSVNVMEVPGHTLDHIAYYNESLLFCGDTLFSGGCGRVFEGTYEQMFSSLSRLSSLPDATKVYCAHEYTQNNLIFAHHIEPKNQVLLQYIRKVSQSNQLGVPTIPSTIALEKSINPFLRCGKSSVINKLQAHLGEQLMDPLSCFSALRKYKDSF